MVSFSGFDWCCCDTIDGRCDCTGWGGFTYGASLEDVERFYDLSGGPFTFDSVHNPSVLTTEDAGTATMKGQLYRGGCWTGVSAAVFDNGHDLFGLTIGLGDNRIEWLWDVNNDKMLAKVWDQGVLVYDEEVSGSPITGIELLITGQPSPGTWDLMFVRNGLPVLEPTAVPISFTESWTPMGLVSYAGGGTWTVSCIYSSHLSCDVPKDTCCAFVLPLAFRVSAGLSNNPDYETTDNCAAVCDHLNDMIVVNNTRVLKHTIAGDPLLWFTNYITEPFWDFPEYSCTYSAVFPEPRFWIWGSAPPASWNWNWPENPHPPVIPFPYFPIASPDGIVRTSIAECHCVDRNTEFGTDPNFEFPFQWAFHTSDLEWVGSTAWNVSIAVTLLDEIPLDPTQRWEVVITASPFIRKSSTEQGFTLAKFVSNTFLIELTEDDLSTPTGIEYHFNLKNHLPESIELFHDPLAIITGQPKDGQDDEMCILPSSIMLEPLGEAELAERPEFNHTGGCEWKWEHCDLLYSEYGVVTLQGNIGADDFHVCLSGPAGHSNGPFTGILHGELEGLEGACGSFIIDIKLECRRDGESPTWILVLDDGTNVAELEYAPSNPPNMGEVISGMINLCGSTLSFSALLNDFTGQPEEMPIAECCDLSIGEECAMGDVLSVTTWIEPIPGTGGVCCEPGPNDYCQWECPTGGITTLLGLTGKSLFPMAYPWNETPGYDQIGGFDPGNQYYYYGLYTMPKECKGQYYEEYLIVYCDNGTPKAFIYQTPRSDLPAGPGNKGALGIPSELSSMFFTWDGCFTGQGYFDDFENGMHRDACNYSGGFLVGNITGTRFRVQLG